MAKKTEAPKKTASPQPASNDPRKLLLARMAGDIAAGIVSAPTESTSSSETIAEVAVDIAEAILTKIGL